MLQPFQNKCYFFFKKKLFNISVFLVFQCNNYFFSLISLISVTYGWAKKSKFAKSRPTLSRANPILVHFNGLDFFIRFALKNCLWIRN